MQIELGKWALNDMTEDEYNAYLYYEELGVSLYRLPEVETTVPKRRKPLLTLLRGGR